jgi:hypothetical protein
MSREETMDMFLQQISRADWGYLSYSINWPLKALANFGCYSVFHALFFLFFYFSIFLLRRDFCARKAREIVLSFYECINQKDYYERD